MKRCAFFRVGLEKIDGSFHILRTKFVGSLYRGSCMPEDQVISIAVEGPNGLGCFS